MRLPVLLRLAVTGGRLDSLRIALTAFGGVLATLLLLCAATVLAIEGDAKYSNDLLVQPGLRPGVAVAVLLVGLPVLFFVGQCVRVGAPARDRRLAEYRMAGATPGQATQVAATETGIAAAVGAVIGFAVFLVGRVLLDRPETLRPLPTDVLPAWWAMLLVAVAVPLGGAAVAALALRRSTLSAFGVVRHRPTQPPRLLPAAMFFGGTIALALVSFFVEWVGGNWARSWAVLLEFVLVLVTLVGLVTGGAAVSAAIGGRIASRAKSPALLLAGRRLVADPWAAGRALPAVLAAVLLGAAVLATRAAWAAEWAAQEAVYRQRGEDFGPRDPFYDRAFELAQIPVWIAIAVAAGGLLVASAEQLLERRRTLAALSAQGTPIGVLAKALLWQTGLPLVPGVVLAVAVGAIAARAVWAPLGTYEQEFGGGCTPPAGTDAATYCADPANLEPIRTVTVQLEGLTPWGGLTVLTLGTVLIALAVCALGLPLLRRVTAVDEIRAA